jgi:hypothetical protein
MEMLISMLHDSIFNENKNIDSTSANSTTTALEQDGIRRGLFLEATTSKDGMTHDVSKTTALLLLEHMIMDLSTGNIEDERSSCSIASW